MTVFAWIQAYLKRAFPAAPPQPEGLLFRIPHTKLKLLGLIQERTGAQSYAEVINDALTAWNYLSKKIDTGSAFWETTKNGEQLELDFVASVRTSPSPIKSKPHLYLVSSADDEE